MMSSQDEFTRREFLSISGFCATGLLLAQTARAKTPGPPLKMLLYVGTYTSNTKSEGIYVYCFDSETAKLSLLDTVKDIKEPSVLTTNEKHQNLYAVNELVDYD